jgi:hypothetical protein
MLVKLTCSIVMRELQRAVIEDNIVSKHITNPPDEVYPSRRGSNKLMSRSRFAISLN